jgi:hypothetical protein
MDKIPIGTEVPSGPSEAPTKASVPTPKYTSFLDPPPTIIHESSPAIPTVEEHPAEDTQGEDEDLKAAMALSLTTPLPQDDDTPLIGTYDPDEMD